MCCCCFRLSRTKSIFANFSLKFSFIFFAFIHFLSIWGRVVLIVAAVVVIVAVVDGVAVVVVVGVKKLC